MIHITEAHELRDALFSRLGKPPTYSEYAAQHDVWPCVRKGAGERWLARREVTFTPSKSSVLYWLRGNSAEALLMGTPEGEKIVVKNGVAGHPDASREDLRALCLEIAPYAPEAAQKLAYWLDAYPDVLFGEIKSTNYSSFKGYKLAKAGVADLNDPKLDFKSYFDQCLNYCVALETRRCVLIVYTLHGDYGDRSTKCRVCGNALGDWIDDFKRECVGCGYSSKKIDLWAYLVEYDWSDILQRRADVYGKRIGEFKAAMQAEDEAGVLAAAPGTPNFYCRGCKVGEALKCEHAGKDYD